MRLLRQCARSIRRNKSKSLINLCICASAVLFLNLYTGNLRDCRHQLEKLPGIFPVTARVTNPNGSQDAGLEIPSETIEKIRASQYSKDLSLTMQLSGGFGDLSGENGSDNAVISVSAVNRPEAFGGMKKENIQIGEGISPDFLEGDGADCLVTKNFLQGNGFRIGDRFLLSVYQAEISGQPGNVDQGKVEWKFLTAEEFRIAGAMEQSEESEERSTSADVLIPFGWVEKTCKEKQKAWTADSASFALDMERPEELNLFKKEMEEIPLSEVRLTGESGYGGRALVVKDENFLNSAARLEKNIRLLEQLRPVVLAVILLVGYVAAWLLVQNRQEEYTLMRVAGMKKESCFLQFFAEYGAMALAGATAGEVMFGMMRPSLLGSLGESLGVFLICYLTGTAAALLNAGRISVMAVLAQRE